MKQWLDTADEYIKSWKIRDVALLKLCVCAAGFLFGMGIPKRHRNKASIAGDAEASKEMLQEERGAVIPVIYHHWRGSSPFLLFS